MSRNWNLGRVALLVILYGLLTARPAFGYVDPNATGLLTQMLTPLLIVTTAGATFLRKQTLSAIGWLVDRIRRKQ